MHTTQRIALGLTNNVDHIITMTPSLLQEAILRLHIHAEDIHFYSRLDTEKDVICTLLYCIHHQQGGERFVEHFLVLEQLSDHFPHNKSVGGTAARAANILSDWGIPTLLHCVSYTMEDKQLIHPLVTVVSSNLEEKAAFHCIMQYNQGLRVQVDSKYITASQSNRIILNNNPAIKRVMINPHFFSLAKECPTVLISGFNAIHDVKILEERLAQTAHYLSTFNKSTTVFYEEGCFHKPQFRRMVRETLGPYLTIYSMNEDEWFDLIQCEAKDDEQRVKAVHTAYQILNVPTVVIHTQKFALIFGENAKELESALQAGVDAATCHLIGTTQVPENIPGNPEGLSLQQLCRKEEETMCCIPTYVLEQKTLTTVGLGDAFIAGFLSRSTKP